MLVSHVLLSLSHSLHLHGHAFEHVKASDTLKTIQISRHNSQTSLHGTAPLQNLDHLTTMTSFIVPSKNYFLPLSLSLSLSMDFPRIGRRDPCHGRTDECMLYASTAKGQTHKMLIASRQKRREKNVCNSNQFKSFSSMRVCMRVSTGTGIQMTDPSDMPNSLQTTHHAKIEDQAQ